MKLKVLKPFGDWEQKVIRQTGEIFEVTKERFAGLSRLVTEDFYEVVTGEKVVEESDEVEEAPAKARGGRRKKVEEE